MVQEKDEAGYTEGIGLNNVKRRLELLYPDNYSFDLQESEKLFDIKLNLDLDQIVN